MRSDLLKNVSRIVVKLGTGVLTDAKKQPDLAQMEQLVAQMARQRASGREIALVTSGAVGAGMGVLGHEKRPSELAELQACAAVGQSRLMSTYEKLFAKFDLPVAQVLLTHADLQVILTTVDGLISNFGKPTAQLVSTVEEITPEIESGAEGTNSATAVG